MSERSPATADTPGAPRPIGWLTTRLDQELTKYVDRELGDRFQLGRQHWQLLRTVDREPGMTRADFAESARLFYGEDWLAELIADLTGRDWLRLDDAQHMYLTPAGEAGFQGMREIQDGSWEVLTRGMTEQEYLAVLAKLTQMVANLEAANAPTA